MDNYYKTLPLFEHLLQHPEMYLGSGSEYAFWRLIHDWEMLMDFSCDGIAWDHPARIEIDVHDGQCDFRVYGDGSSGKVFQLMESISNDADNHKCHKDLFSKYLYNGGRYCDGERQKPPYYLPLMLLIAYSQNIRLRAVFDKKLIELDLQQTFVRQIACDASEEENQWRVRFTPNPKYISEMTLGSAFRAECFRRVCAYSEALTICVQGRTMHEPRGTRTWLNLVAPYPKWKKSADMRLFVPDRFEVSYSFRPDTERKSISFVGGHLAGGQPSQVFEAVFEEFIAENYGEDVVEQVKTLGLAAVLSIFNPCDINHPSMDSDDCVFDENPCVFEKNPFDKKKQKENICSSIMRSLQENEGLRKLLTEIYGI